MWFHFFQKIRNHHLGRTANAKSWNNPEKTSFWWGLVSVKTLFQLLFVFVKNVAVQCVFDQKIEAVLFLKDFFTSVGFWKRWVVFQTHTKHLTSQNRTVYAAGTTLQTDRLVSRNVVNILKMFDFLKYLAWFRVFLKILLAPTFKRALYKNINI